MWTVTAGAVTSGAVLSWFGYFVDPLSSKLNEAQKVFRYLVESFMDIFCSMVVYMQLFVLRNGWE